MALFFDNVDHYEFRSRAVNIEDEEDEVEEEVRTEYKVVFEKGENLKFQKLCILIGKSFSDYINLGVLKEFNSQLVADVQNATNNKSVNKVYRLVGADADVCFTAVDGVAEKDYFNWTKEFLTSMVEPSTEVTVLSTESASSYIGEAATSSYTSSSSSSSSGEDSHFFVRCVHTTASKENSKYKQLDCPNLMSGLSAQVFLHCEARGVRSVHCVVYSGMNTSASLLHQLLTSIFQQKLSASSLKSLENKLTQARATSSMYT